MESTFKICKTNACEIAITGLEYENYLYSLNPTKESYTFEESITINIMIPVNLNGEEGNFTYSVNTHDISLPSPQDETIMKFPKDGLFRIVHIIIPKESWISILNTDEFPEFTYVYKDGGIYKCTVGDNLQIDYYESTLSDLLNIKSEDTTVVISDTYTFCLCRLLECYYKFAKDYFKKICSNKCSNLDTKDRDILWIGLNTIKYLLELGRYFEALEILSSLTSCIGLCPETMTSNNSTYGCGCSY